MRTAAPPECGERRRCVEPRTRSRPFASRHRHGGFVAVSGPTGLREQRLQSRRAQEDVGAHAGASVVIDLHRLGAALDQARTV